MDATETNFVIAREKQIVNVVNIDTLGVGVRVLLNGTWGFDASRDLTKTGVVARHKGGACDRQGTLRVVEDRWGHEDRREDR